MTLIPYHNGVPCGRESDEAIAGRAPSASGPGSGALSGLSAPRREDALAGHLATAPSRLPAQPGSGRGHRRAVGHRRPPHPPSLERPRPRRVGRPPPGERGRAAPDRGATGRPPLSPAEAPDRRRAVVRPEGGAVCPLGVGRAGPPANWLAMAAGARLHPPGAAAVPPPRRRRG